MTERLHVDWTRCRARGICYEILPQLLEADDWGFPLSRTGDPRPVVPQHLLEDAATAVHECPRMALRLLADQRS